MVGGWFGRVKKPSRSRCEPKLSKRLQAQETVDGGLTPQRNKSEVFLEFRNTVFNQLQLHRKPGTRNPKLEEREISSQPTSFSHKKTESPQPTNLKIHE